MGTIFPSDYSSCGLAEPLFYINGNLDEKNVDWRTYGGDPAGSRYSELSQINLQNVKNLQLAWSYDTGENKPTDARKLVIPCQPIVVNGVMYGTTPQLKLFAADAATGRQLWKFDPFADPSVKPNFQPVRGRGVLGRGQRSTNTVFRRINPLRHQRPDG